MSLGDNKVKFLFSSQGYLAPADMRRVSLELIERIGMTPARSHPVDDYPLPNGLGGQGYTLFQPLTESYLVVDVYYDKNETELLISTCMPERLMVDVVKSYLGEQIGPTTGGKLKEEAK
jgi:hypothetical protein